jgi:hypothetical protein
MNTKSTTNPGGGQMVTSLRIPREEHELLKRMAAREKRSLSGQMAFLIAQAAEAERAQEAA